MYFILCDNGHADILFERALITDDYIESDDRLWSEGSGWADLKCDCCGHEYRERVYVGMSVQCPVCDTLEVIPAGVELEDLNYEED